MNQDTESYEPTPEVIRMGCREIQASWTEQQERNRRGLRGPVEPYEFPVVRVGELPGFEDWQG